jgi:hypothetical protein
MPKKSNHNKMAALNYIYILIDTIGYEFLHNQ